MAIAEVLRAYMVRCGHKEARVKLAKRVAGEGLTVERLEAMCVAVESAGKPAGETAAIIGHYLGSRSRWEQFAADVEYAAKKRAQRQARTQEVAAHPGVNMPTESEKTRKAAEDAAYLAARVLEDGWTAEDVAKHQGVSVDVVQRAVDAARGSG